MLLRSTWTFAVETAWRYCYIRRLKRRETDGRRNSTAEVMRKWCGGGGGGVVVAGIKEKTHSFTSTHIFCFCLLHTYDKQYNVTRSSRYGILENFHYPLLQLLFDVLFRHISSASCCICVSYTRIVQEGEKNRKKNKLDKKTERTVGDKRNELRYERESSSFLSLSIGEGLSRVPPCAPLRREKSRNWRLWADWSSTIWWRDVTPLSRAFASQTSLFPARPNSAHPRSTVNNNDSNRDRRRVKSSSLDN